MRVRQLHNREQIERVLRGNPELHVYSLGDLDDFFFPRTKWYGWDRNRPLRDVILVYAGKTLPTVVGVSERPDAVAKLLHQVAPLLPNRFHAHLSPAVEAVLTDTHRLVPHGQHYKMILRDRSLVRQADGSHIEPLAGTHLRELVEFYQQSYPGNWFDERMLETGQYYGLRQDGRLVSVAGVHVYSQRYRVAALGNIVTRPDRRSRGYGQRVTARLCRALLKTTDHIGLNVKTDNAIAMHCYKKLGFMVVAPYAEFNIERKT